MFSFCKTYFFHECLELKVPYYFSGTYLGRLGYDLFRRTPLRTIDKVQKILYTALEFRRPDVPD